MVQSCSRASRVTSQCPVWSHSSNVSGSMSDMLVGWLAGWGVSNKLQKTLEEDLRLEASVVAVLLMILSLSI